MSERRVRLPLAATDPEEIPPIDDGLRVPFDSPSIAVVAVDSRDLEASLATVRTAANAASRSVAELRTVLRDGTVAVERVAGGASLIAPLLEMPEAIARATASLPDHALLVASGVGVVAIRQPTVSVLVTRGRAPGDWPADVRSVRHRFELIVPELDPLLAREVLARLAP